MASVKIHGPTGVLLVDGQKVFPIGISERESNPFLSGGQYQPTCR